MLHPTIKDVARISGVSIGTVDRVLHDRGRVSAKNKEAVLQAIEQLNYRPSQIARALVSRKNPLTLGITYPMVDRDFWQEAQVGIQYACSKLEAFGVKLVVDSFPAYNIKAQIASIDRLLTEGVNGIVLTAVDDGSSSQIDEHIPEDIPYATVINDTVGGRRTFFVGPDDFALGRLAAKLVSLYVPGSCHAAILSPNALFNGTQQRISGFLSKINQEGLDIHVQRVIPVESDDSEESVYRNIYQAASDCVANYPGLNAIYVTNGLIEQVAAAVEDAGKGGEILLFGHEYTSNMYRYIQNGTIAASLYQKPASEWYQAICMLYEVLNKERTVTQPICTTECSIIVKETLPFIKVSGVDLL